MCLPLFAQAGPGSSVISSAVTPQNVPAMVAAFDKYMSSSFGKQVKGWLVLLSHIADGADPATVSIVGLYHSAAEAEAFGKLAQNDPARTGGSLSCASACKVMASTSACIHAGTTHH